MLKNTSLQTKQAGGLWLAHLLSTIGERLTFITLIIIASNLVSENLGTMVIFTMYTATFVFASLFSGKIVDHFDKRKLLIITDLARAILVLGYIFVLNFNIEGSTKLFLLCLILFLVLSLSTIARSCFWSVIPDFIPENKIQNFNSYISINENLGLAIGAAFGAIITKLYGEIIVFYIDAITYTLSSIFVIFIYKSRNIKNIDISDIPTFETNKNVVKNTKWLNTDIKLAVLILIPISITSGILNTHSVLQKQFQIFDPTIDKGLFYGVLALGSWFSIKLITQNQLYQRIQITLMFAFLILTLSTKLLEIQIISIFLCAAFITSQIAQINKQLMIKTSINTRGRVSSFIMLTIRISLLIGIWGYQLVS